MRGIFEYITSVILHEDILDELRQTSRDRLGVIITFNLKMYPNESISAVKVRDWFKHILAIVGYEYDHIADLKFDEMAECWIGANDDFTKVFIRHKYWSYKTARTICSLIKTYCLFNRVPVYVEKTVPYVEASPPVNGKVKLTFIEFAN
jgi:hypothetical protein